MTTISSSIEVIDADLKQLRINERIAADNLSLLPHQSDINYTSNEAHSVDQKQNALLSSHFHVDWEHRLTDDELDKLSFEGFIIIDEIFEDRALLALQAESGFIDYRDAHLAAGVRLSHIRGDKIRWINKDFYAGFYYLQSINELAGVLNRTLYTGIRHSEAHYACYPIGFGYQWHSDNPTGRDERVLSAVFYLNDNWEKDDGGALEIVDHHGVHNVILPVANRLIIFHSDLRHQVQTAYRQRYSIATWMRRDTLVPFVSV